MKLAPSVWVVGDETWGSVRAYLVEEDDGLTLIDTLGEEHPFMILAAIRSMGHSISDLKRIWLTHAHFSHLAGLAALKELSGASVGAHEWEADIVAGHQRAQRVPILPRSPLLTSYPFQFGLAFGLKKGNHKPCRVSDFLVEGKTPTKTPTKLEVLHTPGHTPGHLAFWLKDERVLLAGDSIVSWPSLMGGWGSFTLNKQKQGDSLRKMAAKEPEKVGVGHGDPITENAAELVRSLIGSA